MANATIKITQLPSIGNGLSASTILPVVNTTGTATTDKVAVGNIANFTLLQAGNTLPPAFVANIAYSVANAAQPNITSVGTLNINTLHISGGQNGQYLQTNGAGGLSWVSGGGSGNGVVGGANGQLQFNNAGDFGGDPELTWDAGNNQLNTVNFAASTATIYGNLNVINVNATGNLIPDAIYTDNYYYSNGYPFSGGGGGNSTPGGSNTQIQFNDNGTFGGNSGFTFNKTTGVFISPFLAGDGNGLSNIQGANVSGTVASATVAASANSVDGANVGGEVAYAASANSVAVANVVGIGNIATLALNGSSSQVLYGNGVWATAGGGIQSQIANGTSNVSIATTGGPVVVNAGASSNWTFGTDSTLTAPNGSQIVPAGNNFNLYTYGTNGTVQFFTDVDGNSRGWAFDGYGFTNLPFSQGYTNTSVITSGSGGNVGILTGGNTTIFNGDASITFPINTIDLHNGGNQYAHVLQFGGTDYQSVITGPTPAVDNNAQRLIIQGQRGNGTGEGGDVYFWAGDADTNGGDIKIYAGDADNISTGSGGYVNIEGGTGFDNGGEVQIRGGSASINGAPVQIYGGNGNVPGNVELVGGYGQSDNGGNVVLTGGYGPTNGGQATIRGGQAGTGLAGYGNVILESGSSQWTFDNTGNLVFPHNTVMRDNSDYALSIGVSAGLGASSAISFGYAAGGNSDQGFDAIAIGGSAGHTGQGSQAIAIGSLAGTDSQQSAAVAIGVAAGQTNQGQSAIAIGASAGVVNQPNNSIIINASGTELDGTESGLYVDPVRNDTGNTTNAVYYNTSTKELTYGPVADATNANYANYAGNVVNSSQGNITSLGNLVNIQLDNTLTPINANPGQMFWDTLEQTMTLGMNNGVQQQVGLEAYIIVKASSTITNGQVVMFTGANGDNVQGAPANVQVAGFKTEYIIGVATQDIATNGFGYVTTFGKVHNLNTNSFNLGDILWLSTTTPGALTNVQPSDPNFQIQVAAVTKVSGGDGHIQVRLTPYWALSKLTDVEVTTPTTGEALIYNGSNVWINGIPNIANIAYSVAGANVTGQVSHAAVANSVAVANVSGLGNIATINLNGSSSQILYGNGVFAAAPALYTNANATSLLASFGSNTISTTGNANVGNLGTAGLITATGNITGGNVLATVDVGATGNVWANAGSLRTTATTANVFNATATTVNIAGGASLAVNIGNSSGTVNLSGNVQGNTNGFAIGYRDIPQISLAANTTVALTDAGKHYHSTSSSNLVLTIANNSSVAFATGATINIINQGTGNITIAQGSGVTIYLAGNSTSANRTLSSYGVASITKVATDTWFLSGVGLT